MSSIHIIITFPNSDKQQAQTPSSKTFRVVKRSVIGTGLATDGSTAALDGVGVARGETGRKLYHTDERESVQDFYDTGK